MQPLFAHDLNWIPPKYLTPEAVKAMLKSNSEAINRGDESSNMLTATHLEMFLHAHHDGAQVWVSKEVSDDLSASDISDPDFASIPLLAPSMEFVFEDPKLPSFLLFENALDRLGQLMPVNIVNRRPDGQRAMLNLYASTAQVKEGGAMINLPVESFNDFARGENVHFPTHVGFLDLTDEDLRQLSAMALLAFKVLFFASIDQFKPESTRKQPTRSQGGKAGFRNRPTTVRKVVQYLPRQRQEARSGHAEESGSTRSFLGRRGHLRTFRSERFKNVRGTRIFIAPVPGRDGTVPSRKQFKVRRPE